MNNYSSAHITYLEIEAYVGILILFGVLKKERLKSQKYGLLAMIRLLLMCHWKIIKYKFFMLLMYELTMIDLALTLE